MSRMIAVWFAGSLLIASHAAAQIPPLPAVPPPPVPPLPESLDLHTLLPSLEHLELLELPELDLAFRYQAAPTQPKPAPAPAPPSPPRRPRGSSDDLYSEAQDLIAQNRYERALEYLNRVAAMAGSTRADAALYWTAYAQWKLDRRADALGTLADMRKRFPQSRWGQDAQALDVEIRQASGQSVSPDGQASEELKLLALRGLMNSDPDRAIPMVEQLLAGSSSVRVKENALFVLSRSRSARAREIIAAAAKGSVNPDLQMRAVRYVGAMGGADNQQVLAEAYRATADLAVKRAIIRSLGSAGDRQRLLGLARSEGAPALRSEAVRSLGSLNATTELDELYQAESSPDVKERIIHAMVASRSIPSLTRLATTEKDQELRRTAIRSLGTMGAARTGDTLRTIYTSNAAGEVKLDVIDALAIQQNAAVLVALARAEKDPKLKTRIVERLSAMRAKEATDYLLELLK